MGVMGELASSVLKHGGEVLGIIPEKLNREKNIHPDIQTIISEDMFSRKTLMVEKSTAFIALPGGMGTFDELFEVMTLNQLGYMHKPIGLLNTNRYFDPFVALMENMEKEKFLHSKKEYPQSLHYFLGEEVEGLFDQIEKSCLSN